MRAIYIDAHKVAYADNREMPRLTSHCNVLVKVFYAGICRTDVGIAKGTIPAKDGVVLGHEFCGVIVGFWNGGSTLNGWSVYCQFSNKAGAVNTEKAKITVTMILSIVNFIGVAVLVAIAFGFL